MPLHSSVLRTLDLLIFASLLAISAKAQTADYIVAKTLQARGGVAAIKAIQTERLVGHISFANNPSGKFIVEIKRGGKMRETIGLGAKTMIETTNGKEGWRLMVADGTGTPVAMSAGELRNMAGGADIDGPLLDYASKGYKLELVGKDESGGKRSYKLKVTDKTGEIRYDYIDSSSYLEIKWQGQVENQGKTDTFASYFSDYRKVHGVMFAFQISSGTADHPEGQKIVFDRVEINVPLDDSIFGKPAPQDFKKQ